VSPADHHSEFLIGCLELMNGRLERNMCGLPDAVTNSEVHDLKERAEQFIDPMVCDMPASRGTSTSLVQHQHTRRKSHLSSTGF
jgi:hypothetical protein